MGRCCLPLAVASRGMPASRCGFTAAPTAASFLAAVAVPSSASLSCSRASFGAAAGGRAAAAQLCSRSAAWTPGASRATEAVRALSSSSNSSSRDSNTRDGSSREVGSSTGDAGLTSVAPCSNPSCREDSNCSSTCSRNFSNRDNSRTSVRWSAPASVSLSSNSNSTYTRGTALGSSFGQYDGFKRPSAWSILLQHAEFQPLLMAGYVVAAAAAAAASSVSDTTTPTAATQQHQLQGQRLQQGYQLEQQVVQDPQQVKGLVGVPGAVPLTAGALEASRLLASSASLPRPKPRHGLSLAAVENRQQHQQRRPNDPKDRKQRLAPSGRRQRGDDYHQKQNSEPPRDESYMSWKEVLHVFGIAALPMVGFGLMDQLIMIRLGDLLDTTLGVKFGLATLSAAAVGQLCSDTAGVLFGSTIESCANRLGFPQPNLTAAQRASAVFSLTKTLGAASGVCCGCLLGMLQLLVLDLDRADRLKHQQQAALFVYDASRDEVWSKAIFGEDKAIRMQKQKNKCFTTWVIENKAILNCPEASEDPRFNPEFDEKSEHKTRSVLAAPVMNASGDVIAALVFFNKHPQFRGRFSEDDERMVEMMSRHVQIFMEKFEYGAAEDRRMISLPQSEHVSQYHAAAASLAKAKQAVTAPIRRVATAVPDSSSTTTSASNSSSSSTHGDNSSVEVDGINERGRRWQGSGDIPGGPVVKTKQRTQLVACDTCSSSGCVLLHSLGTSSAPQHLSPVEPLSGRVGSLRRGLAMAAIAAATAAGIDAVAADGAPAWWLRWLFCLPEDDDYIVLAPENRNAAASVKTDGGGGQNEVTPEDRAADEGPPGSGDSKPKDIPPPPYWRATFPHLYGPSSTSSARIVEVDRE